MIVCSIRDRRSGDVTDRPSAANDQRWSNNAQGHATPLLSVLCLINNLQIN